MKYYINAVGLFLFIAATIGFIVPAAVSANDSLMVIGGFAWLFSAPVVVWYWLRKIFIKKKIKKEA